MFVGIIPTIDGRPRVLNAYVHFIFDGSGLLIDLHETIHLSRNAARNGWTGYVDQGSYQTTVTVADGLTINDYTIRTELLFNGAPVTQAEWPWHQPIPDGRWDTWTLTKYYPPGPNRVTLRLLG